MNVLKIYSEKTISPLLRKRAGETKFGEKLSFVKNLGALRNHDSKFVIIGIPEDIGVRANYGNAGTSKAWEAALSNFLNIQSNEMTNPENIILLGEIDCDKQMEQAKSLSTEESHYVEELGELVTQIDHKVSTVLHEIISAGKFPIVIGGGHNNSFGNLMGASKALGEKLNCINFDAHTDFRSLEHRHSGNGFSYAFENGYLDKYFIIGLHRNYTSERIFKSLEENPERLNYNLFEDISIKNRISFLDGLKEAEQFCCAKNFGIELDMDAIEFTGSSAMSPSGFSLSEARKYVDYFSKLPNATYLHICEGAPALGVFPNQVGKAIGYLISDAISDDK